MTTSGIDEVTKIQVNPQLAHFLTRALLSGYSSTPPLLRNPLVKESQCELMHVNVEMFHHTAALV